MKQYFAPILSKYSYLISIGIHAIILLLFMFISLRIDEQQKWHEIDLIFEQQKEPLFTEPNQSSSPSILEENSASKDITESTVIHEESEVVQNPLVSPIDSPLLELPDEGNRVPITSIERNPSLTEALTSAIAKNDNPLEAGGYSSALVEGGSDAYFLHETKPNIKPLMDDTVIVEFKLLSNGRVDMSSISVVSYRRAEHWETLRKAMKDWRFGFTGPYNPEKRYRIRCNFTLK